MAWHATKKRREDLLGFPVLIVNFLFRQKLRN